MSIDSTNKNEQEMRKKVSQYEAPFDPADWKAMKAKLAHPAAQTAVENGRRSSDLLSSPGTSIVLKTIIAIGSIIALSTMLWLGTSLFGETKSSTNVLAPDTQSKIETNTPLETPKEKNTIDLKKESGQDKQSDGHETELGFLPETTNSKEQNLDPTSVNDPLSFEKQEIQKSPSSIESNKNKINQKTGNSTLNVGGAEDTINPFSSSSTTRNIEATPIEKEPSTISPKTTLPNLDQGTNQEAIEKKEDASKTLEQPSANKKPSQPIANANTRSKSSAIDQKEMLNKSTLDPGLASASNSTNRSVVGLELLDLLALPTSLLDSTAALDFPELPSLATYPDPIGPTAIKRFSVGAILGLSLNAFTSGEPLPASSLLGLTSSYRLNSNWQLHLDLTRRSVDVNFEEIKHVETNTTDFGQGFELDWSFQRSLEKLVIYETPISVSYQANRNNRIFRHFRFHMGLNPGVFFVPILKDRVSAVEIGSFSPEPPENWVVPNKKAGLKKADLGLLVGMDIMITENLYLNYRANVHFRDLTENSFWNVDAHFNPSTNILLSVRWSPLNF